MRSFVLLFLALNLGYPQEWMKEVFDTIPVLTRLSLALDSSGLPRVAYGYGWEGLRYAEKQGAGWHFEMVDSSSGEVYWFDRPVLCLDTQDRPHVAFLKRRGETSCQIVYATKVDSIWVVQVIDSFSFQPWNTLLDMAVSPSGIPHLVYTGLDGVNLIRLRYATQVGDFWQIEALRDSSPHWMSPSIALSRQDEPGIAFLVSTGGVNKIDSVLWMWRDSTGWHTSCVDTLYLEGAGPSAQIDSAGRAHMVYIYDDACLRYAVQEGNGWRKQSIHFAVGWYCALDLALDQQGLTGVGVIMQTLWLPLYFYQSPPGEWHYEYVEENPEFPSCTNISLAFNKENVPLVSYGYSPYDSVYLTVAQRVVGVETPPQFPKPLGQFVVFPTISRQFCFAFPENIIGTLRIFTANGSLVFTKAIPSGLKTLNWSTFDTHGKSLPSGIYFATFETGSHTLSRKLVVR